MSQGKTFIGIQYLRGMAAVIVACIHADGMMGFPIYYRASLFNLHTPSILAVQMFFCISGFIMAIICLDENGAPKLSIAEFVKRRFIRIVPFMWFCIIGYSIFTLAGTGEIEWPPTLRAMVLWPVGALKPNVLWTLRLELIFYMVIALCLLGPRKHIWLLTLWCLLPILVRLAGLIYPALLSEGIQDDWVWVLLMGHQAGANMQFGIGILVGLAWVRGFAFTRTPIPGGFILIAAYVAIAAWLLEVSGTHAAQGFGYIIPSSILSGGALLLAAMTKPSRSYLGKLGTLLGDASYAIYLVHNIPLLALLEISRRIAIPGPQGLHYALFVMIAVAFGIVVHKCAEKPLISLCARLTGTRAHRPVAT